MSNKLSQLVAKVNGAKVPPYVKQCLLSGAFNFKVKFAATSGIRIAALSTTESTVHLKNRIRVQNHIGGIHACGMAILAESATGADIEEARKLLIDRGASDAATQSNLYAAWHTRNDIVEFQNIAID